MSAGLSQDKRPALLGMPLGNEAPTVTCLEVCLCLINPFEFPSDTVRNPADVELQPEFAWNCLVGLNSTCRADRVLHGNLVEAEWRSVREHTWTRRAIS